MLSASFTNGVENTQPHFQQRPVRTHNSQSHGDAYGNHNLKMLGSPFLGGLQEKCSSPGLHESWRWRGPHQPQCQPLQRCHAAAPGREGASASPCWQGSAHQLEEGESFHRVSCSPKIKLCPTTAPRVSLQTAAEHTARAGG